MLLLASLVAFQLVLVCLSDSNRFLRQKRSLAAIEKWNWGFENDSFPHGHEQEGRVAIILTGQLRSANRTFDSGTLIDNYHLHMFGPQDPPTTAATIVEWMFKPLARQHPLDVFMYLTAHPDRNNTNWDGRAETYEPQVGDLRACEIFSSNDVFNGTGNRFFCLVEAEVELSNVFTRNYSFWSRYYTDHGPPPQMKEQLLQQLYAMYRGNLACKQHALSAGVSYSHKLRVRPDIAVARSFPDLSIFDFKDPSGNGKIFFANRHIYNNGNEDWFNIGLTEHMDHLLDRYQDFVSMPLIYPHGAWFTAEQNLMMTMKNRYGINMGDKVEIWMVVIRVAHHSINTWLPPPNNNQWKDLST